MAEPEKKTVMVLKVDLQCHCCCKKIQKILCRIPQIRDRVFDEKANTVTIAVICCSPEKIRDKLCSKGGKIIKSIEIKEPPMPKPEEPENPREAGKPNEQEKAESSGNGNEPPKNPAPGPPVGLPPVYPFNPCCGLCYDGYGGGPCYHNYGFPPHPQPCCDGNYARRPGYVYGRPPCCVTRRCDYFSEENTTGCKVM